MNVPNLPFRRPLTGIGATLLAGSMAGAQLLQLQPGPQLFVDDYLIERAIGLERTSHQP